MSFAVKPHQPFRFVNEEGVVDPVHSDDSYFFLFDAHNQRRKITEEEEERARGSEGAAPSTSSAKDEDPTKALRPSAEAVQQIMKTLMEARSNLDPIFDTLRGMDAAVGLFSDRPTDPPQVTPKDRLKGLAASLQRRRDALTNCAQELRSAAASLRSSASADRQMIATVSQLRTRYRLDWDRGHGRLEANLSFLPERLLSLLPPDLAQGTGWTVPLARDKQGGLVAVSASNGRVQQAVQGLPEVLAELQRLQQSYWSSLGLFEARRQLRTLPLDAQARKGASIRRVEALLEGLSGESRSGTALGAALQLYVEVLYLQWVRRDLQRSRDPFSRNMSAVQPKASDVALPLVALDAHARACVDVRAALAMGSGVNIMKEEHLKPTKTGFLLGEGKLRIVVEEERVTLERADSGQVHVVERAVGMDPLALEALLELALTLQRGAAAGDDAS